MDEFEEMIEPSHFDYVFKRRKSTQPRAATGLVKKKSMSLAGVTWTVGRHSVGLKTAETPLPE